MEESKQNSEEEMPLTETEIRLRLDSMALSIEQVYAKVLGIGFLLEDIVKELTQKNEREKFPMKVTRYSDEFAHNEDLDDLHVSSSMFSQVPERENRYLDRFEQQEPIFDDSTGLIYSRTPKIGTSASGN